jgi:hypothetical protein
MTKFQARLTQACNESKDIPPYGKGRQTVLANLMGKSQEAVRKWFSGESMPRGEESREKLASILGTTVYELFLNISHGEVAKMRMMAPRQNASLYAFISFKLDSGMSVTLNHDHPEDYDILGIMNGEQRKYKIYSPITTNASSLEFALEKPVEGVLSICAYKQEGFDLAYNFTELSAEKSKEIILTGKNLIIKV